MFGLHKTDLYTGCHTHGCYNIASHYFGHEDSPNGTVYYVCDKCSGELKNQIVEELNGKAVEPLPFEPEEYEVQPEDKVVPLKELSYLKLKSMAKEMQIEGYSDKNKGELIELIEKHTEVQFVVE